METSNLTCEYCKTSIKESAPKCPNCGFPTGGTVLDKELFYHQIDVKKSSLNDLRNEIFYARVTLWIIAGLTFLLAVIGYFSQPQLDGRILLLIINVVIAGIFLLLASYAEDRPFTSLILAITIYVVSIVYGAVESGISIGFGLLLKAVVLVFLIKGAISAREVEQIKKDLDKQKFFK